MPSLKMPKMPKADLQAPKVDITLPSVDVSLPKAEVDIQGPEATAQAVKIEGEIKATEKDAKGKESKFKLPKFGMPSFGWSTTKETSGGVADVEASLKEPQVTVPSAGAEGEITLSGPAIQAPSAELEIGTSAGKDGEKGKLKMPDVKLPSVKLPKVKAPQVQAKCQKARSAYPKWKLTFPSQKSKAKWVQSGVETPTLAVEADVPDLETEASGWKIQMPSLKMPKMPKADLQAPKVDITLPSVDVSLPKAEVDIQGPEATAQAVKIEGEIKATEKDAKGKESKFKLPKFGMPSFGWSTTKETSGGVADVEASLKEPQVTVPSAGAEGEITLSGPAIQAPSAELEIGTSAGKDGEKGKLKMPDVKLPSVKLPKVKAPQVQVSLPKVEADISLPKSQAEMKEGDLK
ncbi:unnamed protein product [Caretta caretta]